MENFNKTLNEDITMTPADRINQLMAEQGIKRSTMSTTLGITPALLITWLSPKKGTPPMKRIGEIADILQTDVRYLLTGVHEHNYKDIAESDKEILSMLNELSKERKEEIRHYARMILLAEKGDKQTFEIRPEAMKNIP